MDRRRESDRYIEPRVIRVTIDGVTHEGILHISLVSRNRYQYSVSCGGEIHVNREDLMPSTDLCEVHGKMDLAALVSSKKREQAHSI